MKKSLLTLIREVVFWTERVVYQAKGGSWEATDYAAKEAP